MLFRSISGFLKNQNSTYIKAELTNKKDVIASSIYYPASLKDQKLDDCEIHTTHSLESNKVILSLSSPCLCRFVEVSYDGNTDVFDKNYFDIIPGEITKIMLDTSEIDRFDLEKITLRKLR